METKLMLPDDLIDEQTKVTISRLISSPETKEFSALSILHSNNKFYTRPEYDKFLVER